MHLERVKEQIELRRRVQSRLESLAGALDRQEPVEIDQFIKTIEVIAMFRKYYTEEQMQEQGLDKGLFEYVGKAMIRRSSPDLRVRSNDSRCQKRPMRPNRKLICLDERALIRRRISFASCDRMA